MATVLGANTLSSGGYQVDNSLRFHNNTYLTATFGSAPTLATKNTISLWFKRSSLAGAQQLYATNSNAANIIINDTGSSTGSTIAFYSNSGQLLGPRLYRDTSAWMHIVFAFDSTQGTAANRFKVYINGVEETSFSNTAYPDQDVASQLGVNGQVIEIGTRSNHDRIFEGYMAETAFVDGQALAADSFGEFDDSGNWRAIDISDLTFGNNGFYLEYKGTGTSANSSGIGADTSGNDLHFAVTNFTAVSQSLDTCTNNFATINPLDTFYTSSTLSDGNLTLVGGSTHAANTATIGLDKGKWYWETRVSSWQSANNSSVGITSQSPTSTGYEFYNVTGNIIGYGYLGGGNVYGAGSTLASGYGSATGTHIIGVALDLDNNKIAWSYDGTFQGSANPVNGANMIAITAPSSLLTGLYFPAWSQKTGNKIHNINFGSPPFAISSTQADDDGQGNFEYDVPAGYFALCSKNLAEYGG